MLRPVPLAIVPLLALLPLVAVGAAATYADPRGDAGTAPDLVALTVETTDTVLRARVMVAEAPALPRGAEVFLPVDTDRSTRTGDGHGVDLVVSLRDEGRELRARRWNGSAHVPFASGATGVVKGRDVVLSIPLSVLGAATTIGIGAVSARDGDSDAAPNNGSWSFQVRGAARVQRVDARFAPSSPRAGRLFALRAARASFDDGSSRAVTATCRARLGGSTLRGRACRWALPAGSRGKRLTVTVRVAVPGAGALARTFRYRIR